MAAVWVKRGSEPELLVALLGTKINLRSLAEQLQLHPGSLRVGSFALECDESGSMSCLDLATIKSFAAMADGGEGTKSSPFLIHGRESVAVPIQAAPGWVRLSSKQKEFVDRFLQGDYSLPRMHTGVADVPVFAGLPSMLLFELGREEFTHAAEIDASLKLALTSLQDTLIVAGTPGCGKTRSLCDILANEFGLYFTMSTVLNGGSVDLSTAVIRLKRWLILDDTTDDNRKVVEVYVMLLLACRMVAYEYCRDKGATPLQWLLLQVAGRGLHDSYDLFLDVFLEACKSLPDSREGVCAQWDRLLPLLNPNFRIIAVDEAQIAVTELARGFFSSESRYWVPLINPMVEALKRGGRIVLLSGTGFTLQFKRPSGQKMALPLTQFVNFSAWQGPAQMMEFSKRVVPLSEEDRELLQSETWGVYPRFSGRFRPFCDVLQVMLLKGMKLGKAAEYVIEAQTTAVGKPEFPKTFYMKVAELSKRGMEGGISLISELRDAVVSYFAFGRGWHIEAGERGVAAIEAGIARLVTDTYAAEISEYLILLAARNFFEDEIGHQFLAKRLFKQLCETHNASPQGFLYQNFVAAKFEAMWKEYGGKMASMPLFKPLLDHPACPAKFKRYSELHGKLREGLWSIHDHSDKYPLLQYLSDLRQNRQLCTSYICEDKYGPDVIRAAVFQDAGETAMIHFSDQQKLRHTLTLAQVKDAVAKSGFRDKAVIRELSSIRVQFVYLCPELRPPGWPSASWDEDVGMVLIDNTNASDIFGEETTEYIRVLKDGYGGAMHLENAYTSMAQRG